jgi:hypothetical protein
VEVAEPVALQQLTKRLLRVLMRLEVKHHGFQILLGRRIWCSEPKQKVN